MNQFRLDTQALTLNPGATVVVPMRGELMRLLQVVNGPVEVQIDGRGTALLDRGNGFRAPAGEMFNTLAFHNPSGNIQTLLFAVGVGEFFDNRFLLPGGDGVTPRTPENFTHNDLSPGADTDFTILSDNDLRYRAIIQADPANPGNVLVGVTGVVSATSGIVLTPGASLTLYTRQLVEGWSIGAGNVVHTIEETFNSL